MTVQYPCYDFSQHTAEEVEEYQRSMERWAYGTSEDEGSENYADQAFAASEYLIEVK